MVHNGVPDIRRSSNEDSDMEEEMEETARLRKRKWLNDDRGAQLSSVTSHSPPPPSSAQSAHVHTCRLRFGHIPGVKIGTTWSNRCVFLVHV